MINFRQIRLAGTAFGLLTFISGCATLNAPQKTEVDISAYSNITTVDALKKLESNLKQSQENNLAIFAPKHYSTADKALAEARLLISKNEPRAQVVQKVAVASAVLKNGDLVMRKVKDILEDQLIIKEKLNSLKTQKVYRSEYGSLEERLNSIIREIENGDVENNEKNRGKLLQDLQKLERRSIRYNAMHEPEEILKRVKYRGGEKLAPLTYDDALAVFQRAEEFIVQNPNYETGIEQMGQEALFAAKRALYITEQVAALSQKVSVSLEQVILDEEYRLYRVARELNSVDLRDNPLEMQSEQLANIAKNKAEEYRNKEGLIIALRDTLIKVRDSSAELTALNDASIKLKKEKSEWLAKEALFKAKVSHLKNNLTKSQLQLDQTQQKLLSLKDENNQLFSNLNIEKTNSKELQTQLNENRLNADAKIDAITTLTAQESNLKPTQEPAIEVANQAVKEKPQASANQPDETNVIEKPAIVIPSVEDPIANINDIKANKEIATTNPAPETTELKAPQLLNKIPAAALVTTTLATPATPDLVTEKSAKGSTKQPLTLTEGSAVEKTNMEVEAEKIVEKSNVAEIKQDENISTAQVKTQQSNTNQSNTTHETLAASTISSNNPPRAKITEKETMDALESIMELISVKPLSESKVDEDVFVDASE